MIYVFNVVYHVFCVKGHPNVRLFITHGGLHSLEEATYNALPIVGIPFFGDQRMNMKLVERNGIGKMVDHIGINEESMLSAVNEVLTNPKYETLKDILK